MGDALDFIAPGINDLARGDIGGAFMNIIDPIGTPLANFIGLNSPGDYAFSLPTDWPSMWKEDWRRIKHLLVPDMRRDREAIVNSADTPRRIIFGQVRVSGQLVYATTSGGNFESLHMIIALAGHPVHGFGAVYLDDKLITDPVFSGSVGYQLYDGTQTSACSAMIGASGGIWTADHIMRSCAYLYVVMTYNDAAFPSGLPIPKVVVQGAKVYDPRTGLTGYSDNPALCAYYYMMMPEDVGGMGCESDEVDIDSVIEAANYCDDLVSTPTGTEKRYTCNGTINIDSTAGSILLAILSCMDATAIYSQGTWKINIGKPYTGQVVTIDESWLNGGITFKAGANKNGLTNTVKGTWVNPADHYAQTDFPIVQIPGYLQEDKEELVTDLQLAFTNSQYMAQRIARIVLERSRNAASISFPCNLKALQLQPNMVVALNNDIMGWDNLLCRVSNWSLAPTGGINLQLNIENPDIYDIDPADLNELPQPTLTNLPDPWFVPPPNGIILDDDVASATAGLVTRLLITVERAPDASVVRYDVEYKKATESIWITAGSARSLVVPGVETGAIYQVRARAYNTFNAVSEWTTQERLVLGLSDPPSNVTGLRISVIGTSAHLYWNAVADAGVSHYAVRFSPLDGASWASSIDLVPQAVGVSVTVPAMVGSYLVKAVRVGGAESSGAASLYSAVGAPPLNAVETYTAEPDWTGTKTNLTVSSGVISLTSLATIPAVGVFAPSSTVDLGQLFTSRVSAVLTAQGTALSNTMDSWQTLSSVESLSGAAAGAWGALLELRTTDSDPALAQWGDWQVFSLGDYSARAYQFRLTLTSYDANVQVSALGLTITIDMPDRTVTILDQVCPAAGLRIDFDPAFRSLKSLVVDPANMATGDYKTITSKDETGFNVRFYNAGGTGVERTFDAVAVGYGEVY